MKKHCVYPSCRVRVVKVVLLPGEVPAEGLEPPGSGGEGSPVVAEVPLAHRSAGVPKGTEVLRKQREAEREAVRLAGGDHSMLHAWKTKTRQYSPELWR